MSRRSYGGYRPYVSVGARHRRAAKLIAEMKKAGRETSPVEIAGLKIAKTFWGEAWCRNLESYSDYENRLPRGRTYARNGSVIDLQIETGRVRALVYGSECYEVDVEIEPLARKRWTEVKGRCAGQINSLIELLKGSISKGVMEVVSRKGEGLFPSPDEITLRCSCPDWANLCKHVAASLYGVGARLDHDPALLFTLRGVDPTEMVETAIDQPVTTASSRRGRGIEAAELSSVFGVDIDLGGAAPSEASPPRKPTRKAAKPEPAAATKDPRPKLARLSPATLQRLHDRAATFVAESPSLSEREIKVQLARGRLYFRRGSGDLMARITPLSSRSMLLESPHGRAWTEHRRGQLATVLKAMAEDREGEFGDG